MALKNLPASILARLKNQSKEQKIAFQVCLQLFFQEEFLRRLSLSDYKENLILKGGMFIYTLTEFDSRPTRDMDFLVRKLSGDLQNIQVVMTEICNVKTENDFLIIEVLGTEQITLDKQYPGVRVKMRGRLNNIRVPFSVDIGIDGIIIPSPVLRTITTRLDGFKSPEIYTYSIESTISEKFDAIIKNMENNSRMKDYFDIYYLSGLFDFDGKILREAIKETVAHRNHNIDNDIFERIENFPNNSFIITQWKSFEPAKDADLSFKTVILELISFLKPVVLSLQDDEEFDLIWDSNVRQWGKQ